MKHAGDKHKQSFYSWGHLVSMLFCQLTQAGRLREICGGNLNHLGMGAAPTPSNPSYANRHRNPEIFKEIFFMPLKHRQKLAPKLELLLGHDGFLPVIVDFTHGDTPEINSARHMELSRGSMVLDDRGYIAAEPIFLRGSRGQYLEPLREVVVCDMENRRTLIPATNNFDWDAQTIADLYRTRWQLECFCKMFKQDFKIKTFFGASKNAVKIQVWTAFIAILLTTYLKFRSKAEWLFATLATSLKWSRDLPSIVLQAAGIGVSLRRVCM